MKNREILLNLIKETERSKELNEAITKYFKDKGLDNLIVMKKFRTMLEGNLEFIDTDEVHDLIVIFGGEPQADEDVNKTLENEIKDDLNTSTITSKNRNKNKNKIIESELYNKLVVKTQSLEKELKNKDKELDNYKLKSKELEEKIEEMSDKMDKFGQMFELFKKFNITEKGQLIKVEEEVINEAYLVYTIENKTEHKNTFIIEKDDTINVVSEYYSKRK